MPPDCALGTCDFVELLAGGLTLAFIDETEGTVVVGSKAKATPFFTTAGEAGNGFDAK
jgi:hypothetical protein